MYISEYFIEGYYIGYSFYGNNNSPTLTYILFIKLAFVSYLIGIILFYSILEQIFRKTRYILTIINLTLLVPIIIFPYDLIIIFMYLCVLFNTGILALFLLWIIENSSEEIQSTSIFMLIGLDLYLIGSVMDSISIFRAMEIISPIIPPILFILGTIITIFPTIINPKFLGKTKISWLFFNAFLIIVLIIVIYDMFIYRFETIIFLTLSILIFFVFLLSFYGIKQLLKTTKIVLKKRSEEIKESHIIKALLRYRKITEEEVTNSNKEKICLVCKGDLKETIYICPDCEAIYCYKCATFLSNRENTCWVCTKPFDKSKPILLPDSIIYQDLDKQIKKVAFITVIEEDFLAKIDRFEWKESDRDEFIGYMLSLSPQRRNEIIDEMIEKAVQAGEIEL
ncbi:MAG: hypothetical protein ACTSR8_12525 [Promethearchaeota archaeon]